MLCFQKAEKKAAKNSTSSGVVSKDKSELKNEPVKSEKRSIDNVGQNKSNGPQIETKSKKSKNIQNDPNASDVYKSLFNTCEKAKKQTQGHWVTFNPQYF